MEMVPVRKTLVWYTLLPNLQTRSTQLENGHPRPMGTGLVTAGGVPLPLLDDHGLKVLTLGHLGLDIGDQGAEVWHVLSLVSIE
jgi:hypothetical protein